MRWAEVQVQVDDASEDAVSNILIEEGCSGTASTYDEGIRTVRGYLPVDDLLESRLGSVRERIRALPDLGLTLPSTELSINWVEDKDWEVSCRTFFKPIRVGKIVVSPSWEEPAAEEGDIVVQIDPGMAFGTGYHESTRLCLQALQDFVRAGDTVFDIGTGSGILAVVAAKLGAGRVIAVDIDPVAVSAAIENVARNEVSEKVAVLLGDSPRDCPGSADLVVCNIVPDVIIRMAPDLAAKLNHDGVLITSGIVQERTADVTSALESVGLETSEIREENTWVAVISRPRIDGGSA
ncbi:MAG: 50S ribosomal protein L11 methyltransferase [Armatimonadota bacterium]|nr:50S ribosomal protein L11 methyltransferase [Armatimonadota bacterium]